MSIHNCRLFKIRRITDRNGNGKYTVTNITTGKRKTVSIDMAQYHSLQPKIAAFEAFPESFGEDEGKALQMDTMGEDGADKFYLFRF